MAGLMLDFVWSNFNKAHGPPKFPGVLYFIGLYLAFFDVFQPDFWIILKGKLILITFFTNYDPLMYEEPVSK